ncbi:T9SS type A sorting domain-containing protein [Formosa sediminum]|uniref:T9SS type A sorting domain-containing protein n=1 Tax=Formosa sediminum TaxID=2594004 RepID=A0A516GVH6_9FLAO|nr:T9SS type A sorting domain-containing protein [Formosa sediminum]QDO95524.1 T9SS type A sorting domain-containing protein [Formosa sediminum]
MKKNYKNILMAIVGLATTGLSYAQSFATYTSATEGVLGDVNFTIAFSEGDHDVESYNYGGFTGDSYESYPGAWNTPAIRYNPVGNYSCTITFEQAIPNLKFYVKDWVSSTTEFNHDFTLLSNYGLAAANSKTLVASVAKGIIEFTTPVTTLTFTRTNGDNSGHFLFTLVDGPTLGINDEVYANNTLKLFPSPSSDFVQISGLKTTENYNIFNVLGAVVKSGTISDNQKIGVSNLLSGLYFLKLESGNTIKFIKK